MIRYIFTATAVIAGSSTLYLYLLHQRLSSRIQHESRSGKLGGSNSKLIEIESVPEQIFTDQYFALHDRASKSVSRDALPSIPAEALLSKLVRRNMSKFARFPQALAMKFGCETPEQRVTFEGSHIHSLDYNEGDVVCGVYRVVARGTNKVEFEMSMKGMEYVNGRLAISVEESLDHLIFATETFMWRRVDETRPMPLEKPVLRWMHETAAWWLIDSGVDYLMDLEN